MSIPMCDSSQVVMWTWNRPNVETAKCTYLHIGTYIWRQERKWSRKESKVLEDTIYIRRWKYNFFESLLFSNLHGSLGRQCVCGGISRELVGKVQKSQRAVSNETWPTRGLNFMEYSINWSFGRNFEMDFDDLVFGSDRMRMSDFHMYNVLFLDWLL